jgi:hypothetical protein
MSDRINNPEHYTSGAIECIDAMKAQCTQEEFEGHLKCCVVKYMWRWRQKGGVEDLRKARWYANKLIAEQDE